VLIDLAKSAALVLSLSFLLSFVVRRWQHHELSGQVVSGLLFGAICVVAMMAPIQFAEGIIFDARFVILSVGSFYGGPIVGGIAGLVSIAYRLWVGGAGAVVSIGAVTTAICIGLIYRVGCHKYKWPIGPIPFLLFGLVAHLGVILWFFLLPPEIAVMAIKKAALPFLLVFAPATAMFAFILNDIDRRVSIEKSLRKNEARLRLLTDNARDMIYRMSIPEGVFDYVSPASTELTGYSPAEFRSTPHLFANVIHPDWLAYYDYEWNKILRGQTPPSYEYQIVTKSGDVRWLNQRNTFETDDCGNPTAIEAVVSDITKRKLTELELHEAHNLLEKRVHDRTLALSAEVVSHQKTAAQLRKLSSAVEQSSNVIFITDIDGTIEYVNAQFTKSLGYSPDEVIGKNPRILQADDTPRRVYKELWRTVLLGNEWRGELKDRRKDGKLFWAAVSIIPIRNENEDITHFAAMHEDITKRKEAERATDEARHAAELANKAKSDLMANMSHELRTPLNAIIGFSDTMKQEVFGPIGSKKYREYLGDIYDSGRHLLDVINEILDIAAIEAGALDLHEESISATDVVTSAMRIITQRANDGRVSISSSIAPDLPLIYVDVRRVKQVLLNLLSNAIKFTPPGGDVSVTARVNEDGSIAIAVSDTGVGMDQAGIAMALSKFGQVDSGLDRKREGTGLGLPLTKGLMEAHGGEFIIESKKGRGTVVTAVIPKERVGRDDALPA